MDFSFLQDRQYLDLDEPTRREVFNRMVSSQAETESEEFSTLDDDTRTAVLDYYWNNAPQTEPEPEQGFFSNVLDLAGSGFQKLKTGMPLAADVAGGEFSDDAPEAIHSLLTENGPQPKELKSAVENLSKIGADWEEAKGFMESAGVVGRGMLAIAKEAVTNPKGLAYISAEQVANMAPSIAGMLAGGKLGALGGAAAPVTVPVGAFLGGMAGGAAVEMAIETAGFVDDALKELGLDATEENIRALLSDPDEAEKIISQSRKKAAGTAATDAALTLIGGKIAISGGKGISRMSRAGRIAGGAAVDIAGEGISEAAGQKWSKGKVDMGDVALETFAGVGGAAPSLAGAARALGGVGEGKDTGGGSDVPPPPEQVQARLAAIEEGLYSGDIDLETLGRLDLPKLGLNPDDIDRIVTGFQKSLREEKAAEGMADIGKAGTVDEAIEAAARATGIISREMDPASPEAGIKLREDLAARELDGLRRQWPGVPDDRLHEIDSAYQAARGSEAGIEAFRKKYGVYAGSPSPAEQSARVFMEGDVSDDARTRTKAELEPDINKFLRRDEQHLAGPGKEVSPGERVAPGEILVPGEMSLDQLVDQAKERLKGVDSRAAIALAKPILDQVKKHGAQQDIIEKSKRAARDFPELQKVFGEIIKPADTTQGTLERDLEKAEKLLAEDPESRTRQALVDHRRKKLERYGQKPVKDDAEPNRAKEGTPSPAPEGVKFVHDHSSTQVNLPEKEAAEIKNFGNSIPDSEIYTEPDEDYGRETEPHITVRYGMETVDPKEIAPAFEGMGPIKVKMGKVSIFEPSDTHDVVKVDIESPDLREANKRVGDTVDLPGETFKDYKPHVTIAYVKKGEGKKYVGDKSFEGKEITIDSIILSGKDGKKHEIKLIGKPETPSQASPAPQGETIPKEDVPSTGKKDDIVSRVDSAINDRKRSAIFIEEGTKAFPEIRMQEAEEAGRWAYLVAKGEVTQAEFDAWKEQMRKEGRTRPVKEPFKKPVMPTEKGFAERTADFDASPAKEWIISTFGEDFTSTLNKASLADFLEGKTTYYEGGDISPKWFEGAEKAYRSIGVEMDESFSLEVLKEAYLASKKPPKPTAPKDTKAPMGIEDELASMDLDDIEALFDEVVAEKEAEEQPKAEEKKPIGKNPRGEDLFEDEKGRYTLAPSGFKTYEPEGAEGRIDSPWITMEEGKAMVDSHANDWDHGLTAEGRLQTSKAMGWNKRDSARIAGTAWKNLSKAAQGILIRRKDQWAKPEAPENMPDGWKRVPPDGMRVAPGESAFRSEAFGNYMIIGKPGQWRLSDEDTRSAIGGTSTDLETAAKKANQHWIDKSSEKQDKAKEPWEMTQVEVSSKNAEDVFPLRGGGGVVNGKPKYKYSTVVKWGDGKKTFEIETKGALSGTIQAERLHKEIIKQAISEGKPVPPEVLKDYPELAQSAKPNTATRQEPVKPVKDNTEIPKSPDGNYQIYTVEMRDKDGSIKTRYGVPSRERKTGGSAFGNYLFDTLEGAAAEAESYRRQDKDDAIREAARVEEEKKAQAIKAERENIDGFGEELTPMQKGRVIKALNTVMRFNGKAMSVKEKVKEIVNGGGELSTHQTDVIKPMSRMKAFRATNREQAEHERRVKEAGKKTVYMVGDYDLGKTAYDYAKHLVEQKESKPTEPVGDYIPPVIKSPLKDMAPPKAESPKTLTPADILKNAAQQGVKGLDEVTKGLYELFGGGALKSGVGGFDAETYAKAKPHFEAGFQSFVAAGKSMKDFVRWVVDSFGRAAKPYLMHWAGDKKSGLTTDEKGPNIDSERGDKDAEQIREDGEGVSEGSGTGEIPGTEEGEIPEPVLPGPGGTGVPGERKPGGGRDAGRRGERGSDQGSVDYTITNADGLGKGGPKQKYRDNLAAIRLIKSIGDRQATPEEQSILVKYVGWGGLPQAFPRPDGSISTGWESEVNELRDLLSDEEYNAARRSTQDAHYTSQTIIKGVYAALKRFGFKRGKILEPSVGTGNFIGLMPKGVRSKSHITGIELEPITAAIAKQLYPEQRILQSGFQDIFITPGSFDAAVGNPPFGDQKLFDSENPDLRKFSIHNFFFAKSLKGLRENGILAMVVSSSMMDKVGTAQREWLNKYAELIGAIRLPNNAFKENALTDVTTDIIFLRKRAEGEQEGENLTGAAWTELKQVFGEEHNWRVNEYFAEHPEMMLGDLAANKLHPAEVVDGVYNAVPGMVARKGVDLDKALTEAVERLPEGIFKAGKAAAEVQDPDIIVSDPGFAQPYGYTLDDSGRAVRRLPDRNGEQRYELATYGDQPISGNRLERFKALLQLRDDIRKLIRAEVSDNPKMGVYRKHLNKHYDAFVEKYGYISAQVNSTILKHDPTDLPLLRSLEKDYSKGTTEAESKKTGTPVSGPSAGKSAIFTKRTRMPYVEATHAETVKDGLAISLRERGVVDVDHIAKLTGKTEAEVVKGLEGLAFLDPDSDTWETADVYLSGNVKKKLKAAESAANRDDAYKVNVEALKKVIPEDVPPDLIHFRVGASWFPTDFYEDFAQEKLGSDMDVRHLEDLGVWVTRINNNGTSEFDTDQVSGAYIFNRMVKGQDVLVYAKDDKGTRYVDRDASAAAQERGTAIDRAFQDWVLSDGKRRDILAKNFNDKINVDVKPKFDGSHMIFPGMGIINANAERDDQMRTHQKNVIWRMIQKGKGLMDHVVGSGKTFAAIATGLELKRMGLVKKPMYVVPNHLVPQWTEDFQKLYPGANVLAISRDDFSKANRQEFLARIATGDWDAVLIAHSSFGFIRMPSDYEMRFYQEQLDQLEEAMKAMAEEGGSRMTVKQMEKTRDRMRARMAELANRPIDAVVDFSELGVDALFIDEAHEFKNLFYATKRSRIAGLSNSTGSKKAFDMFVKTQYILETNNGRGVFFMTGTPVSNSIAEMYTMMRYMDYGRLKEMGAAHFDQWANIYASAVSDWEIDPTGTRYRYQTKMDFVNVPGMTAFYNDFADVISTADLKRIAAEAGQIWPIPDIKGGKPTLVVAERSELQKNFSEYIVHRFDHMPKDPKIDNPLKATGEAMKAALDIRLIREDLPDHPGSKVNLCINNIMGTYHKWSAKKGTQLVFCDLSVPKGAKDKHIKEIRELRQKLKDLEQKLLDETNDEKLAAIEEEYTKVSEKFERFTPSELMAADSNFSVYDDVKAKLIAQGIPAHEIAFIHDANTDKQKADLFKRVRSGRVRVLIGSTSKMGAGMNVQDKLVALHHLDAPWRPSDLEQREGRIIRQGNELFEEALQNGEKFEIEIFRYATKETLDTRRWQVIERKARSIEQFRQGNVQWGQKIEDAVGEASNAAEMKAAASGNPLILEEIQLRKQLDNLDSLKRSKRAKRFQYEKDIKNYKEYKDAIQGILDDIDADAKKALENPRDNTPQGWKISIDGQEFRAEGLKTVPKETTSEDKDEIKANKKAIKDAEEHNKEALRKAKDRFETAITDALMGLYDKKAGSPGPTLIFRGFRFTSKRHEWRGTVNIEADIKAGGEHRSSTETELNPRGDGVSGVGIVARLNHIVESIAEEAYYSKNDKGVHLKWLEMKAQEAEEQIPKLGDDNYDAEIAEKQRRHTEVLAELQRASANQQDQDFDYSMWGGPSSMGGGRTSTASSPAAPEAPAEAPAETPAKYYRFVDEGGKRSFVPVPEAEPAEVTPWMETFVYQDKFSNVWHVVEITSGLSISYGDTKTEAIEKSIQAVERAGEAGVKNAVKLGVEQHKDVSRPQYSAKIAPGKALELADIQDIFRGYPLGRSANDKSVWIELPSGTLRIKTVQRIAEDKAAFEVAHKRKRKPYEALVGKYLDSKVEIHADLGDKYTLVHELEHFAEDIGLLTNGEIFAINRALREEGKEANAENRADWVEEHLYSREMDRKTRKGRIIQKIEDFIGSLVNLFKKTTGGVLRAFESGKLFGRQGKKGNGSQVPLFSMAGPRAKGADTGLLAKAKAMKEQGGMGRERMPGTITKAKPKPAKYEQYKAVYHGGPNVWQPEPGFPHGRPRLDKIGAGEGSAAFGWGWYGAEAEDVGVSYRERLAKNQDDTNIENYTKDCVKAWRKFKFWHKKEAKIFEDEAAKNPITAAASDDIRFGLELQDAIDGRRQTKANISSAKKVAFSGFSFGTRGGALYKLDIPDDVVPMLLDWDKPLSEQSDHVKKALRNIVRFTPDQDNHYLNHRLEHLSAVMEKSADKVTGQAIYNELSSRDVLGKEGASKYLAKLGIPGNKFLDGVSRNKGEGSYNYVIWDQEVLDRVALLERNGEKLDAIREAYGATFLSKTLSVEGVKERVDAMVRKRMPQYSVRVVRSEDPKVNAKADALLKKLLAVFPKGVPDAKKTLRALNRYEDLAQTLRDDKKDIYEKQKALEEHVKAELSLEDRGRALPLIKNISRPVTAAGREKMLQRAIDRVNEIHEKVEKARNIKAVHKLLKPRKRGHKKGVASHEGLSIEAQGIIKEIREVVKMSDEEAAAEIEALMRALDQDYSAPLSERQEDVIDETETARRLAVLQTFSGLEGKSASDIELARDMLAELLKSGRLELSEKIKAEREERKELREMAVETITGGQGIKSGNVERLENAQHRQTFWGRIKDKLRSFDDMHQSYEFLLDKLSRFDTGSDTLESDLTKRYARMTFDATENEQAGVQACQNLLVQKLSEIWGVKGAKLGKVLQKNSTLKKKTGVTQATEKGRTEIPLSQNQAYKLWQMFQQPTIREEMQSQGYDIQTLMELEQFIDPKIKQWAQWQIDEFYPNYRNGVNDIFKDLFYTNMPKIENYSPISRVYYGKTEDEAMLTDSGFFASVVPGALYSRKNNARDFNILDGDTVLLKHIVDLEHFKAWGKPMREIRSVLGSEPVQRAIKQYHGGTANQVFQQFHNDFASGGKNNGQSLQLLDTIRANFTRAVIGANPVVFLKQLSSIPAYAMDIPVKDFAKGFAYALMHPVKVHKTLMESNTMQARYRVGFERDIILAMQRDVPKTITGQVNISDLLMLSTKLGDKLAIIAGGWSVYAYHLKKLLAKGMSRDAAHKEALHQFDRATKRSQQAGDTIDLGYIQRSWGSIGKLFTMFMTAPTSYYRSTSAGVRNIVAKRGGANVKRLLVSWPLLSMLFQFVADGFDWEPEKQAKAALLGPLNGLFIVRDLVGTMSAALFEGVTYWTAGAPPPLTTANLGAQAMARTNKMIKEGMTDEDFAKTMFDLAEFAGNLTGIPVGPLERVWSGMRDAATGETEHPIRRSMGFSENALGSDD